MREGSLQGNLVPYTIALKLYGRVSSSGQALLVVLEASTRRCIQGQARLLNSPYWRSNFGGKLVYKRIMITVIKGESEQRHSPQKHFKRLSPSMEKWDLGRWMDWGEYLLCSAVGLVGDRVQPLCTKVGADFGTLSRAFALLKSIMQLIYPI
ncbi:hypothetical protein M9H77_04740 [Catharanthus roseus]|uniref:Uncharacterized protein n=1 Tax=Catharanthus roseus TaxID=4058 RepID=A0ACC0CEW8_CATRO|nr:hypothetical protein M9H77_04740 [Catharanthus roseus]